MNSKFLLDDKPLIILPSLASSVGLNESIVLQQLHYWLQESRHFYDGHKWIYNTYAGWAEQFPFWSDKTIRRTITKLENDEIIITGNYNKLPIDKTKWYRINYEKLSIVTSPCGQNDQSKRSECPVEEVNLTRPLPEITTEITTEKKDIYTRYAEFVKMKPSEYEKLISEYGEANVKKMIQVLDNYKGANGKKYKSDYRAILNWVSDKVMKGAQNSEKDKHSHLSQYNFDKQRDHDF